MPNKIKTSFLSEISFYNTIEAIGGQPTGFSPPPTAAWCHSRLPIVAQTVTPVQGHKDRRSRRETPPSHGGLSGNPANGRRTGSRPGSRFDSEFSGLPGFGLSIQTFQVQRDILARGCFFVMEKHRAITYLYFSNTEQMFYNLNVK